LNCHRLQDSGFNIPLKQAEEKTLKPQNPPQGSTELRSFTVSEPLNILRLKTIVLYPEGGNKKIIKAGMTQKILYLLNYFSDLALTGSMILLSAAIIILNLLSGIIR
jgi:hypothetical protein